MPAISQPRTGWSGLTANGQSRAARFCGLSWACAMTTSRQILLCRNYAHARALFLARLGQPDQGRFIRRRRVVFSRQAVADMMSVASDKASVASGEVPGVAPKRGARAVAVIAAILGLGLGLGACSKC